ncbi:replication factor A protein 2 [Mortierella antarctica]|nr:replication factor A protein 2 [Mortierella antarctica]
MSNYNRGYNSSQGQGFVQDSFGSDGGAPKKNANHTLRPVTIKQLQTVAQTHSDGDFKIDGHDLGQITFIGVVRTINRQSTQHIFQVEDGTGTIDARTFSSVEDDAESNSITEGTYVRVVGILRSYNERFSVNLHSIRAIQDFNELTYHLLETTFVHVSFTKSKAGSIGGGASSGGAHNNFGAHSMSNAAVPGGAGGAIGGGDIPQQIVEMINNHPLKAAGSGIPRRDIQSRFTSAVGSVQGVNDILETMVADGFLYTTEDDDHFHTVY